MNTISNLFNNSYTARKNFLANDNLGDSMSGRSKADVRDIKRLLTSTGQKENGADFFSSKTKSILESTQSYSESLRSQRQQAKDTALSLKKLKYQHKSISSKILSAKTSEQAKQAVSSARREVIKLKRQRLDPDVDTEELEAAITHAKEMERVAKKKERHLETEELAKITGKVTAQGDGSFVQDIAQGDGSFVQDIEEITPESGDTSQEIEEMTIEMMEDLEDGMREMLEDIGFGEILDGTSGVTKDMSEEDIKKLEIKHRNSEMKDIVKADADYLKVVFNHFQSSIDFSV